MPVFEVDGHTQDPNVNDLITALIPDMNFTHHATITEFTVAGTMPINYKIQIWRQTCSQFGTPVYDRVEDITVNKDVVCVSLGKNVLSCIVNDDHRVSVQPGDLLGLELNKDSEILFINLKGGPKNFIFQGELTSPFELRDPDFITVQQPQIAFNYRSGILLVTIPYDDYFLWVY